MKRSLLPLLAPVLLGGCYVSSGPYQPAYANAPPPAPAYAPPPPLQISYWDQHFIPEAYGGGWCYLSGPHTHEYGPDQADYYVLDNGYYYYRGPFEFTYDSGHPLPGGGWCPYSGPHRHDYYPPQSADWRWRAGSGWYYQGHYNPSRPPPPAYWPRPALNRK